MKQLLLVVLVAISVRSFSQDPLPTKGDKVFYESIDSVKLTKSEAFLKAQTWFANTFGSAKSVIQVDDKDAGILIGKGFTEKEAGNAFIGSLTHQVWYVINITIRDGKYRIQLYDIYLKNSEGNKFTAESINKHPGMSKKFIKRIDDSCKEILVSFRAEMNKPVDNF